MHVDLETCTSFARGKPRARRFGGIAAIVAVALGMAGCASVAELTSLSEPACYESMRSGLATILVEQQEDPAVAAQLASDATDALSSSRLGPRPFLLASSSGTDYSFFVEHKDGECLLRLYGRQKGFTEYTNNLTYIATRELAPCECAE